MRIIKHFFTDLLRERTAKHKNSIIVVVGQTGSGKSYSSLSLAEKLDKNFNVKRICFNAKDFMGIIKEKPPAGSVLVMDEAGVAMSSRQWFSQINKLISFVNQVYRKYQLITFFVLPDLSFLDVQVRKLAHFYLEPMNINFKSKTCHLKLLRMQTNSRTGKPYFHSFETAPNEFLSTTDIKAPSKRLINSYERKKDAFLAQFTKGVYEELSKVKEDSKDVLTPLEKEIIKLRKQGLQQKEIGIKLNYPIQKIGLSIKHASKILGKVI